MLAAWYKLIMKLSIVILHHGSPKDVTANLQALRWADLPVGPDGKPDVEVLVVNNGRRGANAEIPMDANPDFDLRYFEIPNDGYPAGNNFGFAETSGDFLCILNPDIEVEKDTFQVLMDYMEARPQVGIVAPRLVYPDGVVQDNFRTFPRWLDLIIKRTFLRRIFRGRMRRYLMWDKDPALSEKVDWLTGALQLFTRKSWEALGPNDERYFLFMSDVDICKTAWKRGWEVHFVGETQCLHNDERLSAGGVMEVFKNKLVRIHIWDAVKFYFKWKGR
jgi:N-acetylglucosaminyl-diphospho-decaprenol L-rhamnosyltransferase